MLLLCVVVAHGVAAAFILISEDFGEAAAVNNADVVKVVVDVLFFLSLLSLKIFMSLLLFFLFLLLLPPLFAHWCVWCGWHYFYILDVVVDVAVTVAKDVVGEVPHLVLVSSFYLFDVVVAVRG